MISEGDVLKAVGEANRSLKAKEIARILAGDNSVKVSRSDVNRHLYRLQGRGLVSQDEYFRWQVKSKYTKNEHDGDRDNTESSNPVKSETYYDILEVAPSAHPEIITKAYKFLATRFHPDVSDSSRRRHNEDRMKKINVAYEILSDPKKREEYNRQTFG